MRHLRIYQAIRLIQRTGSIRGAAEHLSVSHSALNRSLLGFEEELGVDIFERVSGGVRLSSAGEILMSIIDSHLNEFEDFRALVSDQRSGPIGHLRISLASELTTGLIPEAIADFQASAPRVTVEVRTADDPGRLFSHEVDLAILTKPRTDPRVEMILSHQSPLVARTTGAKITRASDLQAVHLILPPENTGSRAVAEGLMRKHRLTPLAVSAFAGLWPLSPQAPMPQAQLLPAASLPDETHALTPLGEVQIAILRRQGVALTRPAQLFLTRVQAMLDQAEAQPAAADDAKGAAR